MRLHTDHLGVLNVARARMQFDDKGPHPVPMKDASYETLALPVAASKSLRAAVADAERTQLAHFFADHRDA